MSSLRVFQPSFTAGELNTSLGARVDLEKYQSGLRKAINVFLHGEGGVSNRAGLEFIKEVKNSATEARLVPFQFNTEQTYELEFGHLIARVIKNGGYVLSSVSKAITAVTVANPAVVTANAHGYVNGQEVSISGAAGMTRLNRDNFIVRNATANTFTMETLHGVTVSTVGEPAYTGGGIINAVYEFVHPYAAADLGGLVFTQEADVMYITHTAYAPRKLGRTADDGWSVTTPPFAPTIAAPGSPSATVQSGSGSTTYRYKVAAIDADSGEESLPTASVSVNNDLDVVGNKNKIAWLAVVGASRYVVYKEDNGIYGYIGGTEGLQFIDENITSDLADTPQVQRNPFNGVGNYPRCATFVDQRLALASTKENPQAIYTSQSTKYENFGTASPAKASDAITFRIRARQVNEIRSMIPVKGGLMVFTSDAEWLVTGSNGRYLDQTPVVDNQGYRGSALIQPIVVGNTVLFAQNRGGVIRDFSYDLNKDGFDGKDLTILARHLFRYRKIKAWAFAQSPHSIVWVVLNDGSMATLTYLKEHDVWGWSRQQTDGVFEDVSVVAEGEEDVPYFIVRRNINGVQRRYVERLRSRNFEAIEDAFFVDSGLSYEGPPISRIYLPHLVGKTAVALVDGNVVNGLEVGADGFVDLPNAGSIIHAGLPYTATIQTLDLDLGSVAGIGSVQGRWKSITEATLRVQDTRGIWTGPTEGNLTEYKQRAGENYNAAIQPFTGDINITPNWDWTKSGATWVKQFDPLPMTILGIMPDVTVGR